MNSCLHLLKVRFVVSFFLLISASTEAQVGFLSTLDLQEDEPNSAQQIFEYQDNFVLGGQYFDQRIGRWTAAFSFFNKEGDYLKHITEQNDTVFIALVNNTLLEDSLGLYIFSIGLGGYTYMVHYNFEQDSVWSPFKFNRFEQDFVVQDYLLSKNKSKLFLCGANINTEKSIYEDVKLAIVSQDTTVYVTDINLDHRSLGKLIRENLSGELVIACNATKYLDTERFDEDFTYLMYFDQELNLLSDKIEAGKDQHFRLSTGMTVDKDDNIIVTGSQHEYIQDGRFRYKFPAVAKYDPDGNILWMRRFGNSRYNKIGWGNWNAVIESVEKDGYILIGAEAHEPRWTNDSIVAKAAIGKISYDGDSIWYRTYSYRQGLEREDVLNDIIISSDGYYVSSGSSSDFSSNPDKQPWLQSLLLKTDSKGIYLKEGVSSIELNAELDITIYPNPICGPLYISQKTDKNLRIWIYDAHGKRIENFTIDGKTHTHILDTSAYTNGTYYMHIRHKQNEPVIRTFVVIK